MNPHASAAPVDHKLLTPGVWGLLAMMAVGFAIIGYRLIMGLAAVTNLNDQYPWGIWIAIDVASGVALAAGGFTTAALAHVFHRRRYAELVRPALLTALLGYTFVGMGLMVDLGRYYNIWHPSLPSMWQGRSVLFEVAMCVMCYLTVLYIEFLPIVCERFMGQVALPGVLGRLNRAAEACLRGCKLTLDKTLFLFIIAGVVLSCLHQSSLGALMLIAPYKMHPLWYTPILPLLFLLSAIMVGFPMVVFESLLSSWSFGRVPELPLLGRLSRLIALFLGIYFMAKVTDLVVRGALPRAWDGSTASWMFLAELGLGVLAPMLLLASSRVRRSVWLLFGSCSLVIAGVALNRINVYLVAYHPPYATAPYFPSLSEILVTAGLIATLVFVYRALVTVFPVLPRPAPTHLTGQER